MWGICAEQWMAIAAGFQALFSGFLLWVVCRQTKISGRQNEILENINQFDKVETMLREYVKLHGDRRSLWRHLRKLYQLPITPSPNTWMQYRDDHSIPASLDSLIDDSDFPPGFEPSADMNLRQFIDTNHKDWEKMHIWVFALHIAELRADEGDDENAFVHMAVPILSYFWDNWAFIIENIQKYRQPDPRELLLLTWLELAIFAVSNDYSVRSGKTHLFKLAKTEWTRYKSRLLHQ